MQVSDRMALGQLDGYCWECGRWSVIDARSCLCSPCAVRWLNGHGRPATPFIPVDVDGTLFTKAGHALAA